MSGQGIPLMRPAWVFPSQRSLPSPFRVTRNQTPKTAYLMKILNESTNRSSNVVATVSAVALLHRAEGSSADCEPLMKWWHTLEKYLRELVEVLNSCEENIKERCTLNLVALSRGFAVAAQLLSLKRRFLSCLSDVAGSHGAETPFSNESGERVGTMSDVVSLLKGEEMLLAAIRRQEAEYLQKATALQEQIFLLNEESEPFFGDVEEAQGKRTYLESLWHAITAPFDSSEGTDYGQQTATTGEGQLGSNFSDCSGSFIFEWDDTIRLNSIVECAFASASQQHTLLAERNFAAALFLFCTKCSVVEELVEACFQLKLGNDSLFGLEKLMYTDGTSQREGTVAWLSAVLPSSTVDVLPVETLNRNPQPPYFVVVVFLTLLWNSIHCMWKRGRIREAYEWLRVVDLDQLQRVAEQEHKRRKEQEVSSMDERGDGTTCAHDGEENLKYVGSLSWDYIALRGAKLQKHEGAKQGHSHSDVNFTDDRFGQLLWFIHHVSCLRDVCALALLCSTPYDVMYVTYKFYYACRWQRRHWMHLRDEADAGGKERLTEFGPVDSRTDVLSLILFVVENYLARRSVRVYHSQIALSPRRTPSDMTIEESVRQVCDELVYHISYGKIRGVEEAEVALSLAPHDVGSNEGFDEEAEDEPSTCVSDEGRTRFHWLALHVLSASVRFACDFRSNIFFQNAWVGTEKGPRSEKFSSRSGKEDSRFSASSAARDWHSSTVQLATTSGGVGASRQFDARYARASGGDCGMQPQESLRSTSWMIPVRMTLPSDDIKVQGERCSLWLPSRGATALLLLPTETVTDEEYSASSELALRLLVIACRYSDSLKLLPLHCHLFPRHCLEDDGMRVSDNHHSEQSNSYHALFPSVVHGLNVGISILVEELRNSARGDVVSVWQQQRELSLSRFRVNHLMDVTLYGLCSDELAAIEQQAEGESSLSVLRSAAGQSEAGTLGEDESGVGCLHTWREPVDFSLFSLDPRGNDEPDVLPPDNGLHEEGQKHQAPSFIPDIQFDFSAFNSETLYATKRLVKELMEREEECKGSTESSTPLPVSEGCGISMLSRRAREILHEQLPLMWRFASWRLIYGTRFHGYSYSNMINACQREVTNATRDGKQTRMILLLELDMSTVSLDGALKQLESEETGGLVIGVCMSHPLCPGSRRFYGGSTTFVFQIRIPPAPHPPIIRTFRATGRNDKYINCTPQQIAIGGGGGCSLFLSNSLTTGSTAPCATFDSPPLTHWSEAPSTSGDSPGSGGVCCFDVRSVEVIIVGD